MTTTDTNILDLSPQVVAPKDIVPTREMKQVFDNASRYCKHHPCGVPKRLSSAINLLRALYTTPGSSGSLVLGSLFNHLGLDVPDEDNGRSASFWEHTADDDRSVAHIEEMLLNILSEHRHGTVSSKDWVLALLSVPEVVAHLSRRSGHDHQVVACAIKDCIRSFGCWFERVFYPA